MMEYSCVQTIECNQGAVRAVRYNVDGNYCLTCGSDKRIKLWNPSKGLYLSTYAGHGNEVLDAASSCDNSQIISCGLDKTVILWDVVKTQPLRRLRGHVGKITSIVFNEESTMAVSGSYDNSVMCWDIKSRQYAPVQVLKEARDCITSVKVTDHEILTSSLDCRIRVYDIRMGSLIEDYVGEPLSSATFTSDGQCILVSCTDSTVKLFDKSSGEMLSEYTGHRIGEYYIESCTDYTDSYVFSGSIDGSIWCWDFIKMQPVNQLVHKQNSVVHSISRSPTEKSILSASGSCIKLWSATEKQSEEQEI
ncbi:WD repeat domain-containing protein 83 [Planococcus citri]|uniref:WD repeat domain-containing protein 83 n=1 Tax=Planococcus citri TaxID=170843 RepID=UPI0031F83244